MLKEANSLPFLLLTRWMGGAMVLGALALWCKVAMVICNTGNPLAPTTCIVSQPAHLHISGGRSSSCSIAHAAPIQYLGHQPIPPGVNYEKQARLQFKRVWVVAHWRYGA